MRLSRYILLFFIALVLISISACNGDSKPTQGGSDNRVPPASVNKVNIGNITPIPLDGSIGNTTSVNVTNSTSGTIFLDHATLTQNGITTDISSNNSQLVNLQLCHHIQGNGDCSIQINTPATPGNFLLSLSFIDSAKKIYKTSQIITYTDKIPATNGFIYSTVNNNVYNYVGQSTTVTVPFRLDHTYSNLTIKGNNPSFNASYICPGNALTQGTLCTAKIVVKNLGTINFLVGHATLSGNISLAKQGNQSIYEHANLMKAKNQQNNFQTTINLNVSQNLVGNLITSAINPKFTADGAHAQTITLLNNGAATITGISIIPVAPVTVTNSGAGSCAALTNGQLASNTSCTFTINATSTISGETSVTVNYANGASSGNINGTLSFNIIYINPAPGPAMTMTSGQGSLQNTIINSTAYYNIVVKNTGTISLTNITFTNPSNFNATMSWDTSSTCPTDGTASLNAGQSCTLVIKFAPTSTAASGSLTINSTASYVNGSNTGTYTSANITAIYSAVTSVAFLYLTPNAVTYSIRADGLANQTQTYTLTNGGGTSTTVASIAISPTVTGFSILGTGTCVAGTTILAAGGTCTINTKYGTVTTAQSSTVSNLNVTYLPYSTASTSTSFAVLTFNASTAALVSVSNISVTNTTSGSGTSASPYQFTNTPLSSSQITILITYNNTGTAAANNFNVALNNLPEGYSYNAGSTTCGIGQNITSLAASSTCNVSIYAVNSLGLDNPYALTGTLNVNIPGYSYTDASTGLNTNSAPTYASYNNGNTIYVTANALGAVTANSPTSFTASAGGSFNVTFTASSAQAASLPITITIPNLTTVSTSLIYGTTTNTCNITTATGSCNINITNQAGSPAQSYSYAYVISPNGSSSGITQYLTFTLQ